ncbi:unnamed protein product [Paramecium sonneborni]|nr:unnamed protein product [Paramecium sonneborni]
MNEQRKIMLNILELNKRYMEIKFLKQNFVMMEMIFNMMDSLNTIIVVISIVYNVYLASVIYVKKDLQQMKIHKLDNLIVKRVKQSLLLKENVMIGIKIQKMDLINANLHVYLIAQLVIVYFENNNQFTITYCFQCEIGFENQEEICVSICGDGILIQE